MRTMIGCAAMLAAMAFVFGLAVSLVAVKGDLAVRFMIPAMIGATTFVAAICLFSRDHLRHKANLRSVHDSLLASEDMSDEEFSAHFLKADSMLIVQTRHAIARFFEVPPAKVLPTDELARDLHFHSLEPGFHSFVVYHVLETRRIAPPPFVFRTGRLHDIADFAAEIPHVLDWFGSDDHAANGIQSDAPERPGECGTCVQQCRDGRLLRCR